MANPILTSKCTLVPSDFYKDDCAGEYLAQVVVIGEGEVVGSVPVPQYGAHLVWAAPSGVEGEPELYRLLCELPGCAEYNKILFSWLDGILFLTIAQGNTLLLANTFPAADFATAQYYIFLSMKSLQLNPEVSTICAAMELSSDQEMSLYHYFKAVVQK